MAWDHLEEAFAYTICLKGAKLCLRRFKALFTIHSACDILMR